MSDLTGRQIQQYRIDDFLGASGLFAVYRGWDHDLERPVRVQVVLPQYARLPYVQKRFPEAVVKLVGLSHPAMAPVYGFAVDGEVLCVISELSEEVPFSLRLSASEQDELPLDLEQTLLALAGLAEGLAVIHQAGVVHRDLTAQHLWVNPFEKRLRASDYDLAHLMEGGAETIAGSLLGDLSYMAPEQILAEPVSGRTDVYSLGVILYRVLTGQLPMEIKTPVEAVQKHQKETIAAPSSLRAAIPGELDELVVRMLNRRADERPDAAELAQALQAIAAGLSVEQRIAYAPQGSLDPFSGASLPAPSAPPPPPPPAPEPPRQPPPQVQVAAVQPAPPPAPPPAAPVQPAAPAAPPPVTGRIVVSFADGRSSSHELSGAGEASIGRTPDNDIALNDPRASRRHAQARFDGQHFFIRDVGSTNGTSLQGKYMNPQQEYAWPAAAVVQIGDVRLRCEPPPAPPALETVMESPPPDATLVDVPVQLPPAPMPPPPPPPPQRSFRLRLEPTRALGLTSAVFTVLVENSGETSLQVDLSASDPGSACQFQFSPAQVKVRPAGSSKAVLDVRARADNQPVEGRVINFTVVGQVEDAPALMQQSSGEWEQASPQEVSLAALLGGAPAAAAPAAAAGGAVSLGALMGEQPAAAPPPAPAAQPPFPLPEPVESERRDAPPFPLPEPVEIEANTGLACLGAGLLMVVCLGCGVVTSAIASWSLQLSGSTPWLIGGAIGFVGLLSAGGLFFLLNRPKR